MTPQRVHDGLVGLVAQMMRDKDYPVVLRNRCYKNAPEYGEIDVLAQKEKYFVVFECKSNNEHYLRKKAVKQLERAERYFRVYYPDYRVFKMLVYWKDHEPVFKWIKGEQ